MPRAWSKKRSLVVRARPAQRLPKRLPPAPQRKKLPPHVPQLRKSCQSCVRSMKHSGNLPKQAATKRFFGVGISGEA